MPLPIVRFTGVSAETRTRMLAATIADPFATSPTVGGGLVREPGTRFVVVFPDGDTREFVTVRERGPRLPSCEDQGWGVLEIAPVGGPDQ